MASKNVGSEQSTDYIGIWSEKDFIVLSQGLDMWKEEGTTDPLWIKCKSQAQAQSIKVTVYDNYHINHIEQLGGVLIMGIHDGLVLAKEIELVRNVYMIHTSLIRGLYRWQKSGPDNPLILKFSTSIEAIKARKRLIDEYNVHRVVVRDNSIRISSGETRKLARKYADDIAMI